MAARVAIEFVGESYADETKSWSSQEAINCEPIPSENRGTRSVVKMRGTPGLASFGTVGTGGWRGGVVMDDVAYVVMDTTLYSVDSSGSGTSLGTIEGAGRIGIAENGSQVIVVNGDKAWTYEPGGAGFAEVTDNDYPSSVDCCFVGQYIAHAQGEGSDQW